MVRMKFSHRVIVLLVGGCVTLIYIILLYAGLVPSYNSRDESRLQQSFLADNPLMFYISPGKSDLSQCRSDFTSPGKVISTLDLAERTDYKTNDMGQYSLPHLSLEDAIYRKNVETLNVIIVPHSHVDPGWLETVDEYYSHKVENILTNMVRKLHLHKDMTFVWAEIVFFSKWWTGVPKPIKEQAKDLIKSELTVRDFVIYHSKRYQMVSCTDTTVPIWLRPRSQFTLFKGRLEIVLGGWVMPDEASTVYTTVIDQLQEGHQWVYENLGVKPQNSWSIDPFGHSGTMPYLWKKAGMSNMVIQRIHQGTKGALATEGALEFTWKQYWDSSGSGDIRCHVMPYMLYSLHHTCGPDKFVCAMYDFKQIPGEMDFGRDWAINDENIAKRAQKLYEQYRLKGSLYKHNTILVPLGDDFRFNHQEEWDQQYENYKKLMNYMSKQKDWKINIKFGTLKDYFDTVQKEQAKKSMQLPAVSGDFFPYSDQNKVYWTGYYSTRPFDKRFSRDVESRLKAAEMLNVLATSYSKHWNTPYKHFIKSTKLRDARRELGLFLHHDAITGTSKVDVVQDYEERLFSAFQDTEEIMEIASQFLLTKGKLDSDPILKAELIRDSYKSPSMHRILTPTKDGIRVVIFNPTGQPRSEFADIMVSRIDIEIRNSIRESVPFQINPIFKSDSEVNREAFEILFPVEVQPFGMETYIILTTNRTPKSYWSNIKIYNTDELIVHPELLFGQDRPRRRGNIYESLNLENQHLSLEFRSYNGLLKKITNKEKKIDTLVNVEFKYYVSRGSGAYIFFPEGPAKDLFQGTPIIRVIEGPYSAEVQVLLPFLFHKTRLYKHPGIQGRNVHIQNGFDMQAVNLRDREIIMRLATSVKNDVGSLFTDENGFQIIGRKKHPSDVKRQFVERNYYPFTTMAFIQDKHARVTLHTGQPHGVASLDKGWLEVMLDRQLLYDDERGLGEGVYDNKLTLSKFVLQVEYPHDQQTESKFTFPSLQSIVVNDFLQQPLQKMYSEIHTDIMSLNFSPVKQQLPCDTIIAGIKTLFKSKSFEYKASSLTVHKRGYRCGFLTDGLECSATEISVQELFPGLNVNAVTETSLTHLNSKTGAVDLGDLKVNPMEIKSYLIHSEPVLP